MVKHNAARSLQIRCTGGGRYVIRTENQPADVDTMRIEIVAALGADGDDPAEIVAAGSAMSRARRSSSLLARAMSASTAVGRSFAMGAPRAWQEYSQPNSDDCHERA